MARGPGASPQTGSHEPLELLSAVLEIAELVEARRGRREQHDVARNGVSRGLRHGLLERTAALRGDADARELRGQAAASASGARLSPFPRPPAMRTIGASIASRARSAAPTFVAFESLT